MSERNTSINHGLRGEEEEEQHLRDPQEALSGRDNVQVRSSSQDDLVLLPIFAIKCFRSNRNAAAVSEEASEAPAVESNGGEEITKLFSLDLVKTLVAQ